MFLHREGYPEEGELLFCTVTKIQYHAITVMCDEYGKPGLIPISEVSPGRIRNIRDFVEEGKKIVCKVIHVNTERGHIDLSLRRVNESAKRNKTDAIKQEQKAEKIIEFFAEKEKKPVAEIYNLIAPKIVAEYAWIYLAFDDVVEKNASLEKLGIPSEIAKPLEELVKDKIKPKKVEIIVKVGIKTYSENGLELIQKSLAKAKEASEETAVNYLGGGTYRMVIIAKNFKKAESILKDSEEKMTSVFAGKKGDISFARQEA